MKLFTKGFNYDRIADELLCDKRTVQSWTAMKSTPNDEYWECLKELEKEHLDEVS